MKRTFTKDELGVYLRAALDSFGLTQMEGAKQIGISPRVVQQILHPEREKRTITLETYNKVVWWRPKRVK